MSILGSEPDFYVPQLRESIQESIEQLDRGEGGSIEQVREKRKEERRGKRFNQGKLGLDQLTPFTMEELAQVLDHGKEKYGKFNWMLGLPWTEIVASLKRHLSEFEKGNDFDDGEGGSGRLHMAHVLCNAMFLLEGYKSFPQFDDRRHSYLFKKKVGLDIDGVLADFGGQYRAYAKAHGYEVDDEQPHWNFPYKITRELWEKVKKDKSFWVNIPTLCDPKALPFEPVAYVTARSIPIEWTEEWLVKNGFPPEPVVAVGCKGNGEHKSKVQAIRDLDIEIFVDDCVQHFIDLSKAGVCTYLMDQPYNRKLEVGFKRIKSLNDLVTGDNLHASNS